MATYSNDPLILILDPKHGALLATCAGPDEAGACPQVGDGEVVPCAGRRLVPAGGTGLEGWRLTIVDKDLEACPLAWTLPGA